MEVRAWVDLERPGLCALVGVLLMVLSVGCGESLDAPIGPEESSDAPPVAPPPATLRDHAAIPSLTLQDRAEFRRQFRGGRARLAPETEFRQVSLMFDAPPETELEWRRSEHGARTGPWRPVEITWSERNAHVGRIILDRPAEAVELRTSNPLSFVHLEFPPKVTARTKRPLTRDLPPVRRGPRLEGDLRTRRQLEAPERLVIPREEWGARDPDKICGREHDPYRMTIHHTASPSDDGGDPARRMRQMQAFHIDDRGWCDIGYHFVVSQSAKIFQGRSTEKRTGAHVGGENFGNIGISLIGNFENQTVGADQFASTVDIGHWVTSTYDIALDREHVKGHTEWPNQGTACPGANLKSRLDELLQKVEKADGSTQNPPDVEIRPAIAGLDNPYTQGSSEEIPDAFPRESFRAHFEITNHTDQALEGVQIRYDLATPYLAPTEFRIQNKDGNSWSTADVQSASANPDPDAPQPEGTLSLASIAAGATKRVTLGVRAERYSIGATDHSGVRLWVRSIDGAYGPQETWDGTPQTNSFGERLRAAAETHVLSRDEWRFESTDTQKDLEGWRACCGEQYERLALNHEAGALAVKIQSSDAVLAAPSWTRIDADTYDELVIRVRSHDGTHQKRLSWHRKGTPSSKSPGIRFRAAGDGKFHTYVIPVGWHPAWSGTIDELELQPLSGEDPNAGAERWYDVDGLYFRSSESGTTTTDRQPYESTTRREPLGDLPEPSSDGDSESTGGTNSRRPVASARASAERIEVKGCHVPGEQAPIGGIGWLVLAGGAFVSRRI